MKKPPYRVYKKNEKEEENSPFNLPQEIDTPQAEQFVSDLYKIWHFLMEHNKKIGILATVILLVVGAYFGYKTYLDNIETKASEIVDKGIFYLREGKKEEALKLFELARKEYPNAPSTKLATFLLGKLKKDAKVLKSLENEDSMIASPTKTSLSAIYIDEGKIEEAKRAISNMKRDKDWTHPEAVYEKVVIALKENDRVSAKNTLEILRGDYKNLPITKLAEMLVE